MSDQITPLSSDTNLNKHILCLITLLDLVIDNDADPNRMFSVANYQYWLYENATKIDNYQNSLTEFMINQLWTGINIWNSLNLQFSDKDHEKYLNDIKILLTKIHNESNESNEST
jgi:hypothetical protein